MSYAYPNVSDASAQLPTFLGYLNGNAPGVPQLAFSGYVLVGFGLSQTIPLQASSPPPLAATPFQAHHKAELAAHIQAAGMDPSKIDWGKWLPIIIQIVQTILPVIGTIAG